MTFRLGGGRSILLSYRGLGCKCRSNSPQFQTGHCLPASGHPLRLTTSVRPWLLKGCPGSTSLGNASPYCSGQMRIGPRTPLLN